MNTVDKWHNDGSSVLGSHSKINPGPEGTRYDLQRHERMKLKNVRYGFFKVPDGPTAPIICSKCQGEVNAQALVVNGVISHYGECPSASS